MARYFRRHLELDAARDCWKWHYWDWREFGKADYSGYEDADHSTIDVSLAVEAARHGVVFTEADMVRMAHTWVRVMWNQSETEPRMASDVAGGAPFAHSALLPNWAELSQWDRKVYELARKAFQEKNPEEQARRAPLMLLCAHRAGIVWR